MSGSLNGCDINSKRPGRSASDGGGVMTSAQPHQAAQQRPCAPLRLPAMRRIARLALLLIACAAAAAQGDAAGEAAVAVDSGAADATGAATPEWLASRSQRRWLINGDTWHRVADAAADAHAASAEAGTEASRPEARHRRQAFYYYNQRTRATAWELPRHAPRGVPLWASRAPDGRERPLGPPLLDLSALSFPDSASDFATIALPAAMFLAAKHAGGAWHAAKRGAAAMRDAAAARGVRCPVGAAPKAD